MKKVFAILLAAAMVLTMGSAVLAQPAPEGYTQMEVFDGTYGFGDAEVTAYTNDDLRHFILPGKPLMKTRSWKERLMTGS